jgi:hypothetical protein
VHSSKKLIQTQAVKKTVHNTFLRFLPDRLICARFMKLQAASRISSLYKQQIQKKENFMLSVQTPAQEVQPSIESMPPQRYPFNVWGNQENLIIVIIIVIYVFRSVLRELPIFYRKMGKAYLIK